MHIKYTGDSLLPKDLHPAPLENPEQSDIQRALHVHANNRSPSLWVLCICAPLSQFLRSDALEDHEHAGDHVGCGRDVEPRSRFVGCLGNEAQRDVFVFQQGWEPVPASRYFPSARSMKYDDGEVARYERCARLSMERHRTEGGVEVGSDLADGEQHRVGRG